MEKYIFKNYILSYSCGLERGFYVVVVVVLVLVLERMCGFVVSSFLVGVCFIVVIDIEILV